MKKSVSPIRVAITLVSLVIFFMLGMAGVLISQRQFLTQGPVAPNAPESRPEARIVQTNCSLTFNVPEITTQAACGYGPCETDNDCLEDLICITADNGNSYCAEAEFEAACIDSPSVASCCDESSPTPTPTPTPTPEDEDDRTVSATASSSSTASVNVTINRESGEEEAEEGQTTAATQPTTKGGQPTIIQPTSQPEIPEELPVAGPADWLRYLQVGLATLGIGALLLLLL